MKRNLIYYIFPVKGSIWRWNIEQMKRFLPHFNGKKVLVVARGSGADEIDDVFEQMGHRDVTVIAVENDPRLRETKHFISILGSLESADPNEATFYAHAKGVTQDVCAKPGLLGWIRAMLFLNLGCIDLVDSLLSRYSAVGAFRLSHPQTEADREAGRRPSWEYSGTFFWLRHSAIFSRNWRDIAQDPYGVEAYPGRQMSQEESYNLTENRWGNQNLYQGSPEVAACEEWLGGLVAEEMGQRKSGK